MSMAHRPLCRPLAYLLVHKDSICLSAPFRQLCLLLQLNPLLTGLVMIHRIADRVRYNRIDYIGLVLYIYLVEILFGVHGQSSGWDLEQSLQQFKRFTDLLLENRIFA